MRQSSREMIGKSLSPINELKVLGIFSGISQWRLIDATVVSATMIKMPRKHGLVRHQFAYHFDIAYHFHFPLSFLMFILYHFDDSNCISRSFIAHITCIHCIDRCSSYHSVTTVELHVKS